MAWTRRFGIRAGRSWPPLGTLLARALLTTPQGAHLYRQRVEWLVTNVFKPEILTNSLHTSSSVIRASLKERDPQSLPAYDTAVADLVSRIETRAATVRRYLQMSFPEPVLFDEHGVARIGEQSWFMHGPSTNRLRKTFGAGRATFTIPGDSGSSWRARVILPLGRYRLQALARASTEGGEEYTAAIVRVAGGQTEGLGISSENWTNLAYDFDATVHEVEIVLNAKGRATCTSTVRRSKSSGDRRHRGQASNPSFPGPTGRQ